MPEKFVYQKSSKYKTFTFLLWHNKRVNLIFWVQKYVHFVWRYCEYHMKYNFVLLLHKGSAKYFFFENALKKTTAYVLKFLFFYLKVQSFRLIMENNIILMAASAGHAVAYRIGPIFRHIIDCVQLYFTNAFTNFASIVSNTYLWWHPTNNSLTVSNDSS